MICKYQSTGNWVNWIYIKKNPCTLKKILKLFWDLSSLSMNTQGFFLAITCKDAQRLTNSSNLQYMLNVILIDLSCGVCLSVYFFFKQDCFCAEGIVFLLFLTLFYLFIVLLCSLGPKDSWGAPLGPEPPKLLLKLTRDESSCIFIEPGFASRSLLIPHSLYVVSHILKSILTAPLVSTPA